MAVGFVTFENAEQVKRAQVCLKFWKFDWTGSELLVH